MDNKFILILISDMGKVTTILIIEKFNLHWLQNLPGNWKTHEYSEGSQKNPLFACTMYYVLIRWLRGL